MKKDIYNSRTRCCEQPEDESMEMIPIGEMGMPGLPDPAVYLYYQDKANRIVWIDGEVDGSILSVSRDIIEWNREDNEADIPVEERVPIKMIIFTNGGDIDAMFHLIDVCGMSKTPIITICSKAYSAGLVLLLCGHKRYALPSSYAMVHAGSCAFEGSYWQVQSGNAAYQKIVDAMKQYVLKRTKIKEKEFEKHWKDDWYFDAEEQVKAGIVDEILDDLSLLM